MIHFTSERHPVLLWPESVWHVYMLCKEVYRWSLSVLLWHVPSVCCWLEVITVECWTCVFVCQTVLSQCGNNTRISVSYLSECTLRNAQAAVYILFVFVCVTQVTVDMSVPPSPVCHSVEMDVYLGQSGLSGPSFLSLPDSSGPVRDSPSSVSVHTHGHTHIINCYLLPVSLSVVLVSVVTGEQGVWLQYSGLLGCVWFGAPDRWHTPRGGHRDMAVLWQPPQSTSRPVPHQDDPRPRPLQCFTCSGPYTPAEEEKGPDAAPPGLALLHWLTHCSSLSLWHNRHFKFSSIPCCTRQTGLHHEHQLSASSYPQSDYTSDSVWWETVEINSEILNLLIM